MFHYLRPLPILAVCWWVAVECGRLARAGGRKKFAESQARLKSCFAPSRICSLWVSSRNALVDFSAGST